MMRWRDVKQGKKTLKSQVDTKKVSKTQNFASVGDRIKAFLTDMFMIMMPIAYIMTYVIMDGKDDFQSSPSARWAISIIFGAIVVIFWVKSGQTPGYKAYNIQVVDQNTKQKPGFAKALLRYIFFLFSAMTIFGLLTAFFRKDKKTLHDLLSGTYASRIQ